LKILFFLRLEIVLGKLEDQLHWYLLNHASDDALEVQLLEQFEAKEIHLPRFGSLDESTKALLNAFIKYF